MKNPGREDKTLLNNGLYVVGGRQRTDKHRKEWQGYDKALILHVHPETDKVTKVVDYVSPKNVCPWDQEPAILFKAATRLNEKLYVCTSTEILVFSIPDFECIEYQTAYNILFPILENEVDDMLEQESEEAIFNDKKLQKIRQKFIDLPEDERQTKFLESLYGKQEYGELKKTREKAIKKLMKNKFIPAPYKISP